MNPRWGNGTYTPARADARAGKALAEGVIATDTQSQAGPGARQLPITSDVAERDAVMFVYNTVWRDRRVLKEAETLVRRGWRVTIIGLSLPRDPRPLHEVTESGVVIRRIPMSLRVPEWRRKSALKGVRARYARVRRRFTRRIRPTIRRRRAQARRLARTVSARMGRQTDRLRRADRWRRFRAWLTRRRRYRWSKPAADAQMPIRWRRRRDLPRRVVRRISSAVGSAVAIGWVAIYAGIDQLAGGELDWWLNARGRWAEFARRAAAIAPYAAVYHGHDLSGIGAAMAAHARHPGAALVYDTHELYVESGTLANRSRTLKYLLKRVERSAYRRANAVITVNASIARELRARYGPRDITIVYNCSTPAGSTSDDRIRSTVGLPTYCRIALYQGALTEVRGLREVAAAVRKPGLERVHLAFMGFGPMQEELEALARSQAQLHILPPVAPAELDAWVASADACVMTNQPAGLNELMSTPNKLFESIAAGVPVITSDFPERRAIVLDATLGPLGAVCDPKDPDSIADAMRSVLLMDADEIAVMRRRCLEAARSRWNWEAQERELMAVYDGLTQVDDPASPQLAGGRAA